MGYLGYLEKKLKAQELRKKGYSYPEIQKELGGVAKGTLSGWCRDVALTEKQALRLFKNQLRGARKGSIIGAKRQQQRRLKEMEDLLVEGKKEVGKLSKRDRFVIGVSLYAAEGTKRDKACNFANSDPRQIKFMINWFREFCGVSEQKLRGAIWIHDGLDINKAINYWSKLTLIPKARFYKTYVAANKTKSRKIRKNLHEFGVFSIRFSDAKIHRKLMGWVSGVMGNRLI